VSLVLGTPNWTQHSRCASPVLSRGKDHLPRPAGNTFPSAALGSSILLSHKGMLLAAIRKPRSFSAELLASLSCLNNTFSFFKVPCCYNICSVVCAPLQNRLLEAEERGSCLKKWWFCVVDVVAAGYSWTSQQLVKHGAALVPS